MRVSRRRRGQARSFRFIRDRVMQPCTILCLQN
jgi:hypothetical protein